MSDPLKDRLVIGVSTRALFDLEFENGIFETEGLAAYRAYQREHEQDPLRPGTGFPLVKGLLGINGRSPAGPLIEVVLLSRNDADSCMRVFNSIKAQGLAITRGAFRGGRDPWPFLPAFHCELFLSAEPSAVRAALDQGTPAALVLRPPAAGPAENGEVRIAFDGDSVLFDEESDRIWERDGPEAFFRNEAEKADVPLSAGPFRPFLAGLARVQAQFPEDAAPIRTALVTARSAPAHIRVINTLRSWNIRVDEAYFLGGVDKIEVLSPLRPHIFLDDQIEHLERAAKEVPSAHVLPRSEQLPIFAKSEVLAPAHRGRGRPRRDRPAVSVPPSKVAASDVLAPSRPEFHPEPREPQPAEESIEREDEADALVPPVAPPDLSEVPPAG